MKASILLISLLLTQTAGFAQGTVYFSNHVPGVGLDAPVFDTDGVTGIQGYWFQAQLYAGATQSSLAPVGPSASFTGPRPGYWNGYGGLDRLIPDVAPGSVAYVQVKVWSVLKGSSYDQVVAAGGKHGASGIFSIVTGGDTLGGTQPPSFPAYMVGLNSFSVTGVDPIIPEPSVLCLAGVGAGIGMVLVNVRGTRQIRGTPM